MASFVVYYRWQCLPWLCWLQHAALRQAYVDQAQSCRYWWRKRDMYLNTIIQKHSIVAYKKWRANYGTKIIKGMYYIWSQRILFCLQISEAVPSISQVMNSISESGGTLVAVQDTEAGLMPRVWFNRHSVLMGGGMSMIQTVVRPDRTFIRVSPPAGDTRRSKHSTSSVTWSVKMVTFAQTLVEFAARTSSGFTAKSTPAVKKKKICSAAP